MISPENVARLNTKAGLKEELQIIGRLSRWDMLQYLVYHSDYMNDPRWPALGAALKGRHKSFLRTRISKAL